VPQVGADAAHMLRSLEAVHDALLRLRPEDSTVTQVAEDVGGFFHLGRFAREYLAMFSEHPSATLHRQSG
jgi:hypothetical protein